MTKISDFAAARTVAGNGAEKIDGVVLRNETTGSREWLQGTGFESGRQIVRRRTGNWTVRGYAVTGHGVEVYA